MTCMELTVLDDLHALVTSPIGWVVPVIGLVIAFGLFCLCVDNLIAAGRRFYLGRRPMARHGRIWQAHVEDLEWSDLPEQVRIHATLSGKASKGFRREHGATVVQMRRTER